jgi:putative ABC transport system permease protein
MTDYSGLIDTTCDEDSALQVANGAVSSIAVKVRQGLTVSDFTKQLRRGFVDDPVSVVLPTSMIGSVSNGLSLLIGIIVVLATLLWILAVGVLALLFSVTLGERRREMGVVRALGATRGWLVLSLLLESGALSLGGALLGAVLATGLYTSFSPLIGISVEMPYLLPSASTIAALLAMGVALPFVTAAATAAVAVIRISSRPEAVLLRTGG